jgi:anti-sigma regulatory factor (Ser/Thr protein kinase)
VKEEEVTKWTVYRDVIFAATQGKFLLITEREVSQYKVGTLLCEGIINERSDIPIRRNQVKEALEHKVTNKAKLMSLLLVLSEAITNTIKHAEEGAMTVLEDKEKNEIRFIIEDKGPGFPLKDLPKTTLLAGYSTKRSMGQGFTLMMKMTKQVALHTSPMGATIILLFNFDDEMVQKPI